jgi:DNA-binding Xre family transcriptional regulator
MFLIVKDQPIGETMNPETIITGLSKEIDVALKAMAKAKTPEEKLTHSKTVKNLCKSLGVFLSFMSDMMPYDDDDDDLPINF